MSIEMFITGTLSFAACAVILYIWGYRKSRRTPQRLQMQMGQRIEARIIEFLAKREGGASLKEIGKAIKNMQVGSQMAGYKLQVEDGQAAANAVLKRMIAKGLILEEQRSNVPVYILLKD